MLEKEQEQFAAIRKRQAEEKNSANSSTVTLDRNTEMNTELNATNRDHEGGFGGQEDLEDRYATTSGEH